MDHTHWMTRSHHLLIALIIFMLIAGCGTKTSVKNPFSVTHPLTQPASSLESQPTSTAYPSFTPTPSQTQNVFDDTIYYATQSVVQTKVAQFPRICKEDYSRPNFSPNGLWMEELCYSQDGQDLVLTLSNSKIPVLWKLLYKDHIPPMDFADGGLLVVHWSNDGRYTYFTSFLGGGGGECFFSRLDTGSGLFRLDLQTGQIKAILPVRDNTIWYGFSISPTDRRLVYGVHSLNLNVFDIATGQSIRVVHEKDFGQGGGYIWSPNGLGVVYSTVTYNANHVGREGYSLRLVDAQSGSERILLESAEDCYEAVSWNENNILILRKNYNEAFIEFDLNSNKFLSKAPSAP